MSARREIGEFGVVLAVLLAGCTDADQGHSAPAPASVMHDRIEWTGCDGVSLALRGPSVVYAASVPPGWETSAPHNVVRVQLQRCERVAWGPFERGPVYTIQEWHSDFEAPAGCRGAGEYDFHAFLQSIWFSDPELAEYARQVHGLPAYYALFDSSADGSDAATQRVWTWAIPGQPASRVDVLDVAGEANFTRPLALRAYWLNGAGVSYMDFVETYDADNLASALATGDLQAPFLHGRSMPSPRFAAEAVLQGLAHAGAAIERYGDHACLVPS